MLTVAITNTCFSCTLSMQLCTAVNAAVLNSSLENLSMSSSRSMDGAASAASSNVCASCFRNSSSAWLRRTVKQGRPLSSISAVAISVLPRPGAPDSSRPCGSFASSAA